MRRYRAIPIDGKDFVYGWLFERAGASFIIPITDDFHTPASFVLTFVPVIPETVGQSTGLKDKNGTDLDWWEGDVFELHGRSTLFSIIWKQGCFWFRSAITQERFSCDQATKWSNLPEKVGDSQTVFSDTKPELLEKQ